MLSVLISVLLSALLTAALLLVTRQRLARQFEDIQRRLGYLERMVAESKLERERSTVPAQLRRLHMGMVRVQEGLAHRFGPFLRQAGRLGDQELAGLEHWTKALGGDATRDEIGHLAKVFALGEAEDRVDVLAGILALFRWRNARLAAVNNEDVEGSSLASLAPLYFREVKLLPADSFTGARAIFAKQMDLPDARALGALEPGALLIVRGRAADEESTVISGFRLLASEWKTSVYERMGDIPA